MYVEVAVNSKEENKSLRLLFVPITSNNSASGYLPPFSILYPQADYSCCSLNITRVGSLPVLDRVTCEGVWRDWSLIFSLNVLPYVTEPAWISAPAVLSTSLCYKKEVKFGSLSQYSLPISFAFTFFYWIVGFAGIFTAKIDPLSTPPIPTTEIFFPLSLMKLLGKNWQNKKTD